jgi:hypothetical protein
VAAPPDVDFQRDIRPVLAAHCLKCHGPEKRRGGLLLTDRASALVPSDSGKAAIVPGASGGSELIRRVLAERTDERMPPAGDRLTPAQVALLRTWIDRGAPWSDAAPAATHWAYVKPRRPELPAVGDRHWPRNPIDAFVLAGLEKEGLRPLPEADRTRLLRRVALDLVGLPPTVAQVDAFVNDPRPDAYERVVDELLASPHYGERWARPWLDLARYADSNGFQRDGFRDIWPYRDWVVAAFNRDLPYDQFTLEQVAGDLLPGATAEQRVATGFNRCTTVNVEGGIDPEESRVNAVFDRVNTTATVWLGTTLTCAQCHNHKYDPFSQQDYYRLFAYFNNTLAEIVEKGSNREFTGPRMTMPQRPELEARRETLQLLRDAAATELKALVAKVAAGQPMWEQAAQNDRKVPADVRRFVAVAAAKRTPKQKQAVADYYADLQPAVKRLKQTLAAFDAGLAPLQPSTTLVMVEMPTPRPTYLLKRGNFLDRGPAVAPGVPAALHRLPEGLPANRLALGGWLVSAENPLLARVAVNRWWAELFGRGLVATPEDFGTKGEPPTHPELLDWLATELPRQGWSMKAMHRLIVTSATYRQSTRVSPELLRRDPSNKLLARGPRLRLDAETIRDSALAVSGLLSRKLGGPPVRPPQPAGVWTVTGVVDNTYRPSQGEDSYRRGLYTVWRRSSPYPSFVAFDAPDRASCVVQRPRTNTPLQALTLMNDPVYTEAAVALASRLLTDRPMDDVRHRVVYAFRLCLARQPAPNEVQVLEEVYRRALARYEADPAAARTLLAAWRQPEGANAMELAAWFQVATVLLNVDETITKG